MKTFRYNLYTHENGYGTKFYSAKYVGFVFYSQVKERCSDFKGNNEFDITEWDTKEKAMEMITKDADKRIAEIYRKKDRKLSNQRTVSNVVSITVSSNE